MPSRSGSLIKAKFEVLLRRDLTDSETLLCEELALNYYTGPILTYLEREAKKPMLALFETVHGALKGGVVRGAARSSRVVELSGRLANAFKKLDLYKPMMTDGEAAAVVELVDRFKDGDIDHAIVIARSRGVKHVRYVLQVAVGNIGKPTPKTKTKIKAVGGPIITPKPADVERSWSLSLKDAEERRQLNEIERAVQRHG